MKIAAATRSLDTGDRCFGVRAALSVEPIQTIRPSRVKSTLEKKQALTICQSGSRLPKNLPYRQRRTSSDLIGEKPTSATTLPSDSRR